jgi:hypothetical protein
VSDAQGTGGNNEVGGFPKTGRPYLDRNLGRPIAAGIVSPALGVGAAGAQTRTVTLATAARRADPAIPYAVVAPAGLRRSLIAEFVFIKTHEFFLTLRRPGGTFPPPRGK